MGPFASKPAPTLDRVPAKEMRSVWERACSRSRRLGPELIAHKKAPNQSGLFHAIKRQALLTLPAFQHQGGVSALAHQTSTGANQTSAASHDLSRLAVDLNTLVARFSV